MKTIVFVHAFGSSSRAWAPQLRALAGRYRLLAPDLPGHGSAAGEPFTFEQAVAVVRGCIDEGDAVHLVGISGGATVALCTALEEPEPVASLVLSGGFAHPPRLFALQRALVAAMPWRMYAGVARGFYSGGSREYADVALEDLERCGKGGLLAMLREIAGLDIRDRLREIAAPTLVVCGARDRPNLPGSRELASGSPGAEHRIVRARTTCGTSNSPTCSARRSKQWVESH